MIGTLKFHMVSKSNHWLMSGQPAATEPLPEYILYAYDPVAVEADAEEVAEEPAGVVLAAAEV